MILTSAIISVVLEASASAGASAQHIHEQTDTITPDVNVTALIRLIGADTCKARTDTIPRITTSTRITTSHGKSVIFPGDPIPKDINKQNKSLGALDYLSTVYEVNDYYETGYWGQPDIPDDKLIYSGPLPSEGFEKFSPPIDGYVTSGFGYREAYNRFHKGIDLHLCIGDTIRSALPGIVSRTGYEQGGYGHFIIITHHNGIETRYAHLKTPLVVAEDKLSAGQPIALGGNSGNSTGPHLHFEIRYMGQAIDPLRVYSFRSKETP